MFRCALIVFCLCLPAMQAAAQTATPAPAPPRIRRWLDIQSVHLSSRFRWVEANTGRITSSTHQWQPNIRARLLLDRGARYTINVGAFGGSQFVSSWNNTGGGLGVATFDFNVKQLFVAAEPVRGLELQAGGLYMMRGENTEITSYDNDAYIVGERLTLRRTEGVVSQVVATVGHIGDYRTPNVFKRFDTMSDVNYGQLLVGTRLSSNVAASADYTYEDGRDILREGATIRLPEALLPFTAIKLDAYQRVSDVTGQGFNVSGDLKLTPAWTVTAGVAHVDRNYLIPGYMSPNADRYERGTRFYSQGTYALTRDLSIGWFHGEAFNIDYDIPNEHRFEILVTVNPTATLKARRVF
jgi:hypothetical protein